ncbi:phosphate starvation-inducible protein PhoH [Fibrobacter sp. UWB15]|jgi:phosphate starvation-inducible PhoH-like protein|uniref:PhoH family protein n=1 Tax=unclassified Fibrobacter TaxID=2634177 RepID=UPI00091DAAE1|nr:MULTISPECIES: PhoH family protein [unclassified Fibrobacter]PWJ67864.1 phosphate starvation-inducible protein PhoH [Fibrobacter sp. UWB6]SHF80513.1 phosphate starvation-inducible protein PhoH [Fibrobacter sp. UWB8]SMG15848.1 phosphate starvation-inducible protein PhoH [Fibrobacter sp. UWB15]
MNELRYSLSDDLKRTISGENETVFRLLESRFCVEIQTRLPGLRIIPKENGDTTGVFAVLDQLKMAARHGKVLTANELERMLNPTDVSLDDRSGAIPTTPIFRNRMGVSVFAKTKAQAELVSAVEHNDIIFAKGPAGTGKTFLAVTLAVASLERHEAERICLVRPAVEAGESLGYLPGDLKEKIAPYLRPIHDSLAELLPVERLRKYEETGAIEVAPLAYMRGRTLKRAFIILDEAQNTTPEQMKMFLTRLGPHSKAIITGDATQVDLGKGQKSGLVHAMKLLKGIHGIAQVEFEATDVLRHPLVKDILNAYEKGKE